MITYQVERYMDAIPEIVPYYELHYAELASNKEIELEPDYEMYEKMDALGLLHLVTARSDDELIGYYIAFVHGALHYRSSLTAHTDIYYLRKDFRSGFVGINFFKFVEKSLKEKGVQRIYMMTKVDSDKSAIWKRLGYVEKEIVFTKMI